MGTNVYTWGVGEGGKLGLGDQGTYPVPRSLSFLFDISVSLISAGASHSIAVSDKGEVYTWGDGTFGKLGHGNEQSHLFPKLVTGLKGIFINCISAGGKHSAVASDKGEVYVWGSDDSGQIGLGTQKTTQNTVIQNSPRALPAMRGLMVVQLSLGAQRSAALTDKGEVFTWGRGDHGRLGHGDSQSQAYPKLVSSLRGIPVVSISSGGGHNVALTESGEVYCWGRGDAGQLGIGTRTHQNSPKHVASIQGIKMIDLSAGGYHTVTVSETGEMYMWGRVGGAEEGYQLLPKQISTNTKFMRVSAGFWHTMAISDTLELYSWGNGEGGRLGHGSESNQASPAKVEALEKFTVVGLSAGESHSIALATEKSGTNFKFPVPFLPNIPKNTLSKHSLSFFEKQRPSVITNSPSSDHAHTPRISPLKSPRPVPLPEAVIAALNSHSDWFSNLKNLRALISAMEEHTDSTYTPSGSRRTNKDKMYFNHFVEVDKAFKNYETTNSKIREEVDSLLKQKNSSSETVDKLVLQRNQSAEELRNNLQQTVSKKVKLLIAWESQIVGKYNTSIERISAELLNCGLSIEILEESIPATAHGCQAYLENVKQQIKSCIQIMGTVAQGTMDETRFQRLQRVAVEMASNILECGRQYLAFAKEQKNIATDINSTYQGKLADLENLNPSLESGNNLLNEREKLKASLRTCRQTIIENSRKIELLVLDEADDVLIQHASAQMKNCRSEEQIILAKQKENEEGLQSIISEYAPEFQLRMQKSSVISNKLRDTGLVVEDRKFDHYEKVQMLATAPRNVYLMRYAGRECVLKEYLIGDDASRRKFEAYVALLPRLSAPSHASSSSPSFSHPVVLPIDLVFFDRQYAYVHMRYVAGTNLQQWLFGSDGKIKKAVWEIQQVLQQIAQGIAYMHSCSVIHRDLQMDNVLMQGNQTPLIISFEFMKDTSDSLAKSSSTEVVLGSDEYIAPEVKEGKSTGTTSSDMWSFGIMVYKAHFSSGPIPVLLPGQKSVGIPTHENERLRSLLSLLLQRDPLLRPSSHQVCVHPYFTTSLVEDMVSSKQLVDSDKKIAAFRAHLSSLSDLADSSNYEHVLSVPLRRNYLVDDVLRGLKDISKDNLCWRLDVQFVGEKGIDYGGLSAEMFSLFFNHGAVMEGAVSASVFSPFSGMFERSSPESYFYLPVSSTCTNKKTLQAFTTVGKMFLKMAVDGRPLPDAFAPSFFKYLLGIPPNLQDLEAYDSELALSFRKLLVLDRVEDFLTETFEGLIPNGETKTVTDTNKEDNRYVQKRIEKYLVTDRLEQLESIRKGFLGIDSMTAHFNLFSPTELALLLCGNSHINAESIKQNFKFRFFPQRSQTPENLAKVLDGLSQDNLRRFLRYITGMVAIPLEGLGKPIIVQCQPISDHLPSAHTCSFQLDMPDYNDFEVTKKKVLKMLEWLDSGFAFV